MAMPAWMLKAAGLLHAELAQVHKLDLSRTSPVPGPAQLPLALLSLPSVPLCGVASYIQILLFFHLTQRCCLNTMQLPALVTTTGQNYSEQTITVLNKINPVPVAGNNDRNTNAIKVLAFKDKTLN